MGFGQATESHPGLSIELVLLTTSGDLAYQVATASPHPAKAPVHGLQEKFPVPEGGLKALFTKELEEALLADRIDLAVHSLKDMAAEIPVGLEISCVPLREDPRDVWISKRGVPFNELREGATIATGAVRRMAQLRHARADLDSWILRGNVDTRLAKLETGDFDGIVLGASGVKTLGTGACSDGNFFHGPDTTGRRTRRAGAGNPRGR